MINMIELIKFIFKIIAVLALLGLLSAIAKTIIVRLYPVPCGFVRICLRRRRLRDEREPYTGRTHPLGIH